MQECPRIRMPAVAGYTPPYATVVSTCMKNIRGDLRAGEATGLIAFPPGHGAEHSLSGNLLFLSRDGVLEALWMTTGGAPAQHIVMRDLRAKLGEPQSLTPIPITTTYGAAIESISAAWTQPGLRVEFVGVAGRFDAGSLVIGTPAGVARQAELQRTSATTARPL